MIKFNFKPVKSLFEFGNSTNLTTIPSVPIHDIETSTDRRARRLKHLIKANHANNAILYNDLRFQNHSAHILGSAYLLGATQEHLNEIYDAESKNLEPWRDAPAEITSNDWTDFLGKREYQRAFIDFFEDELVQEDYDWRAVLEKYLYEGPNPLINNLIAGLAHPLIHLGYGYELSSPTIGIEALAMASCCYNFLHKYLDDPSYSKPKTVHTSASLLELLHKVKADRRFDGLFSLRRPENMDELFKKREDEVLEYWNAWDLENPKEQFEESQRTAVALLVATKEDGADFDFLLLHLLTSSHAVRIILPLVPAHLQISLVRQWWLLVLAVYIAQLRPTIMMDRITRFDLKGKDWKFSEHQALTGKHATDAHYVKAVRAMKEAAETWGDDSRFFLKASVKFTEEFDDWGGFDGPFAESWVIAKN